MSVPKAELDFDHEAQFAENPGMERGLAVECVEPEYWQGLVEFCTPDCAVVRILASDGKTFHRGERVLFTWP